MSNTKTDKAGPRQGKPEIREYSNEGGTWFECGQYRADSRFELVELMLRESSPGMQAGQEFTPEVGERLPAWATFVRWALTNGERQPDNFVDIVEGYHWQSYFGPDGRYIGSDEAGVEPVFAGG